MGELTLRVLRNARELINDHDSWTTGANARDERHRDVHPVDPRACKWCLYGAITAAVFNVRENLLGKAVNNHERSLANLETSQAFIEVRHAVALKVNDYEEDEEPDMTSSRLITQFNDNSRHQDVLAVLEQTIEDLEGEGHGG